MTAGPVRDLSAFSDALRRRGMTVTPDQVAHMARSLILIDPTNRSQVYAALRSLAITDPSHRVPFDEEFRRFFEGRFARSPEESQSRPTEVRGVKPIIETFPESLAQEETEAQTGASATDVLNRRDFAELNEDQVAEAKRLVMSMLWEPSDFQTRRWTPDKQGRRPDLRRTLHGAIGPEGDLMLLEMRKRRRRQRPLIIIADISGSMERYSELFLVFAHAAQRRLDKVEVFTFSTRLTRITEDLRKRDTASALAGVTRHVTDWSGGTKIGETLGRWNREWSRRLARGGPVVLILSDGWDTGDPAILAMEMARLSRSVHRVLWLNPLAARADYRPATRGMKAVLPHIDHLLPAASVNDLRGVVKLLESMTPRRL